MDKLCRMLEISRSGYYAWQHRGASQRVLSNQQLLRELVLMHEKYPAMGLNSLFFCCAIQAFSADEGVCIDA